MPYILQYKRECVDDQIDSLARAIESASSDAGRDGVLNYSISRLIDKLYDRRYAEMNEAMGVLECVKQEFYRRIAGPYEDQKAILNGEVYTK